MSITHFIITHWNDGTTTRYGWNPKRYGRPNLRNLAKLTGVRTDFKSVRLVHADTTEVARIEN